MGTEDIRWRWSIGSSRRRLWSARVLAAVSLFAHSPFEAPELDRHTPWQDEPFRNAILTEDMVTASLPLVPEARPAW